LITQPMLRPAQQTATPLQQIVRTCARWDTQPVAIHDQWPGHGFGLPDTSRKRPIWIYQGGKPGQSSAMQPPDKANPAHSKLTRLNIRMPGGPQNRHAD